jgi:hypothetical protein
MSNGIVKRDPQIQETQAGYHSAYYAARSKVGKYGEVQKKRVLIPKGMRPRRVTDGKPDIHAQHDAQKELNAFKPAWHSMWLRFQGLRFGRRCWG